MNNPRYSFGKPYLNQRLSDLLVHGYARRMKAQVPDIPAEINRVVVTFFLQILPPYRFHNGHWKINENQILSVPGVHPGFVLFESPWNSGVHEMVVECLYDEFGSVSIGMISNKDADVKYEHSESWVFNEPDSGKTYQLYLDTLDPFENGVSFVDKGMVKREERISMTLSASMELSMRADFSENTITFYINGSAVGNPFVIEKDVDYFPTIERSCTWGQKGPGYFQMNKFY